MLPSVINKLIVKLTEGSLHTSDTIIVTYCQFLRLLVAFMHEFPELQKSIDDKVGRFIEGAPEMASKEALGDLGEFLIVVFLSRYQWDEVKVC